MKKSSQDYRAILRGHESGLSLRKIGARLGYPASSVKRVLDIAAENDLTWMTVKSMTDQALLEIFEPPRRQLMMYLEPDWDSVYLQHARKTKPLSLQYLWEEYKKQVTPPCKSLSYQSFCKNYRLYTQSLPAHMRDVSMTFVWEPGEVAMIDYSGDGITYVDKDGKAKKAEIFVAVLACSAYIFCCATPDQKRDSWLDSIVEMLKFFNGVPGYIFLDNSSSLVNKADKYNPKVCQELLGLCSFFDTVPMPVRPNEPRDKALVEGAVGIVQQRILNPLANSQFFSIEEVNKAIRQKLEELNDRPMTQRMKTRRELFEEEHPYLTPLPGVEYEKNVITKTLKVRKDYRIRVNDRRFSVPYQYAGKSVKVVIHPRQGILECFDLMTGERITKHHYGTTSKSDVVAKEHMPQAHIAAIRTTEAYIDLLGIAGPKAKELAEVISKKHPVRISRKFLAGMLSLMRRVGAPLFEKCAEATLKRPTKTYDALMEEINLCIEGNTTTKRLSSGASLDVPKRKGNIRGANFYREKLAKETAETNVGEDQ